MRNSTRIFVRGHRNYRARRNRLIPFWVTWLLVAAVLPWEFGLAGTLGLTFASFAFLDENTDAMDAMMDTADDE